MPHFHHFSVCNQNQSILVSIISLPSKMPFSVQSYQGHFSAKYQGYSLTFWPKMPHFHHFSVYNQNQSMSILVIFRQNTKVIALLFGQKCLIFITFQCVNSGDFSANYKGIALLFGQKCLIFITFQCAINLNQSILVIYRQNTKVILFGQKCLIFITFQCAIKINQFQFWSFFGKIPRL